MLRAARLARSCARALIQALAAVHRGDGFALAELRLPRKLVGMIGELPLHPVLLDAAIQAVGRTYSDAPLARAFRSLPQVVATGACEPRMWTYVRQRPSARTSGAPVLHLDIDLIDRDGTVRVAFKTSLCVCVADAADHRPGRTRRSRNWMTVLRSCSRAGRGRSVRRTALPQEAGL